MWTRAAARFRRLSCNSRRAGCSASVECEDMRRCRLCLISLLLASASSIAATSRAEVIISEGMYNPAGSDQSVRINREWVELYNTGATSVSLAGWQFGDSHDNTWANVFPAGTMIGVNQAPSSPATRRH